MALLALTLWAALAWLAAWTAYSWYCLYCNYQEARTLGVPIRVIPIDHLNKLWLLVDKQVVSLVRRLPGPLGNNSFTRFNYRGWHEDDGLRAHDEMGDAWVLVTPCRNWLYLADPDALMSMYRRGKDFPRWVEITKMLDVFGGPNIATASGDEWRRIRRIANSAMNERCNAVVWDESAALGEAMARYWASKGVFTSVGEDSRTVTLHVLAKACFGQSFPFEGHDERAPTSASARFRFSLLTVMENALLILALTPRFFTCPWLPLPPAWRRLGAACEEFKRHMASFYRRELRALREEEEVLEEEEQGKNGENKKTKRDYTLIGALVRESRGRLGKSIDESNQDWEKQLQRDENDKKEEGGEESWEEAGHYGIGTGKTGGGGGGGMTEDEIYGNMFVFSFAGHDTTAHLLTYAVFFLAANPSVQSWVAAEIRRVLGTRPRSEWSYHGDFPRLRRCLAVLYETLRVKTPVCEVKWTAGRAQQLSLGGGGGPGMGGPRSITVPPRTLVVPSYLYVQKHARYWGPDAAEWRPERWIARRDQVLTADGQLTCHAGNNTGFNNAAAAVDAAGAGAGDGDGDEILLPPPSRGNFLGWSEGARDCPGKRFSHVEWVAFLAALFRDWKVEPQLRDGETFAEARTRLLDFVEADTGYGGLLLQLLHPERVPLVWKPREP
ncbi:cytochrome P450 [Thermothelomyces heterothallicus CBS 202.75]|uniref:cytochrome P450 n=1 Tax=Thermothelomyces heterothallicus CBS 202.75 TaxID=1149848 RepID=UPI00374468E2